MLLRVPLVEFGVWFWWVWFSKPVVGNVIDILVTCDPNTCHSHNSDNIFNVADTMTGSQSWSHEGKIPQHDICKASTKLACQRWMSSSVTRGMSQQVSRQAHDRLQHRWWWQNMSQKIGARWDNTTPTFQTKFKPPFATPPDVEG